MTHPAVAIVLPLFRPDAGYLHQQLASLAAQTLRPAHLVLVEADGTSGDLGLSLAASCGVAAEVLRPSATLDAPHAFAAGLARALDIVPPGGLIAACDQDDVWHPDRLAAGAAELARTGADLVHSDARLIDGQGRVLHDSMFRFEGRQRRPGLRGLLLRNNVTGMTTLMTRNLVARALPLPPQSGVHFYHDLWVALVAEATGGIALIRRPLVDYRQHGGNVMGAVDRRGLAGLFRRPRLEWLRLQAPAYARSRYLAHCLFDRMVEVHGGTLPADVAARLRPLRPWFGRFRGPFRLLADAAWLAAAGHLRLAATSANYSAVAAGRALWALRDAQAHLDTAFRRFDDRLYSMSPGLKPSQAHPPRMAARSEPAPVPAAALTDARMAPRFAPVMEAEAPAVQVLVPTLNPVEVFAGIATAVDLGLGLAARGLDVRFIATDLPLSSLEATHRLLAGRLPPAALAAGVAARIVIAEGATGGRLAFHPQDRFLATAWWTAHVAQGMIAKGGFAEQRFTYLIQDYEPMFYPWGADHAGALASYGLDFRPVFNTTLLRDHFAGLGHGFARPGALCFRPSIEAARYGAPRPARAAGPRRLAVYGRPEVARNLFPVAVGALARFVAEAGLTPDEVEVLSVGLAHDPVDLGQGVVMKSLGKLPIDQYPDWLLTADVGLSLMLSPHPSHPPLEMALSGVRVVTNRFGSKDLGRLSPAIVSVNPTVPGVAAGLARAWALPPVSPADRRIDLAALGRSLDEVVGDLAVLVAPERQAVAAA